MQEFFAIIFTSYAQIITIFSPIYLNNRLPFSLLFKCIRHGCRSKGPCLKYSMRWPFVCQNDLWRKLKVKFASKLFFGESFAKVERYDRNIHGFLKMKLIFNMSIYVGRFSRKFGESFDKAWQKTAFSWKLGGLNCWLVMSCFQGARGRWALSFGVEVSELAGEGEHGPPWKAKHHMWMCSRRRMSFDGRSDAQMSLVKLLFPTRNSHI